MNMYILNKNLLNYTSNTLTFIHIQFQISRIYREIFLMLTNCLTKRIPVLLQVRSIKHEHDRQNICPAVL